MPLRVSVRANEEMYKPIDDIHAQIEQLAIPHLTVRLLVTSTSTWATELLGFAPSWVCYEKGTIILN